MSHTKPLFLNWMNFSIQEKKWQLYVRIQRQDFNRY